MPTFTDRIDALLAMPEDAFDNAVLDHVLNTKRTADDEDVFRDVNLVERTYEATLRLRDDVDARRDSGDGSPALGYRLRRLSREQRTLRPLANAAREQARQDAVSHSPRVRAAIRLAKEPDLQARYLALVREEQARERSDATSG